MELAICTKTLQHFSEKLRGKFTLSTLYLSMISSSCIVYAFSEIRLLERSLLEGQKLQQKEREKRKRESNKKKTLIGAHARKKKLYNVILVKNKDAFCLSRAVLSHLELF